MLLNALYYNSNLSIKSIIIYKLRTIIIFTFNSFVLLSSSFNSIYFIYILFLKEAVSKGGFMKSMRAPRRNDRLIKEKRKDTYLEKDSLPEPSICRKCNATFINGRWTWNKIDGKTNKTTCPACRRRADNYPAGFVELKGKFFNNHKEEIENLIRNTEKLEKGERPLERIMKMQSDKKLTLVTTTGIHIARRIGEALSRSYQGDFSFQYAEGDKIIRVFWER